MEFLALERTLTELDHVRLQNLARRDKHGHGPATTPSPIEDVLDNCAVVPPREVPPDVVTMYSQVLLQDTASTLRSTLTLCYPQDADPGAGLVSVLSPVGANLLGLRVGTVARWPTPAGEEREAEILALLFQPEASGDYSA